MRIHIIGGPASGKTYIAEKISARWDVPHLDLDEIFWNNCAAEYNQRMDSAVRDAALAEFAAREQWVIEGVYYSWVEASFRRADAVVGLPVGVWIRDSRILARFLKRKLGLEEKGKTESLQSLWDLVKWNHGFDGDNFCQAKRKISILGMPYYEARDYEDVIRLLSQLCLLPESPIHDG